MSRYVLRRIAVAIPLLLAISVITFTFINVAPGDPITAMISPEDQLNEKDLQRMRAALGLDQPIPVRYVLWLGQAVQGNFGYSYSTGQPVLQRIGVRMGPTLELMGVALLISTVVGVVFGVLAAVRVYSFWDYFLSIVSLFGLSIPGFFFALVALYIFAARLKVLPAFGMATGTGPIALGDHLVHLILPATVLSLELMASLTRYARSAMLEVLKADFVTTARAKGLKERAVVWRHAFRAAILPLITIVSLRLPLLVGGAIIIETMFQWPGIGLLSIQAIQQRDYPVLMGLTFMVSALVLASNLLADVLYAYADPRIRV
ncbi:MAG TPA: ABC transporter permease [Chloroflexota bacterium]